MDAISVFVLRSPWLNQIGQGTQLEFLLNSCFSQVNVIDLPSSGADAEKLACLCAADGSIGADVLVVPGGNDQRFMSSFSDPQSAADRIRTFVRNGGGYVGICAGMSMVTRGYWDVESWLPCDSDERQRHYFMHFVGLFPHEVENLHGIRRVRLTWNQRLPDSHPMRLALERNLELPDARYNDGNALWNSGHPHAHSDGTEYLLSYAHEQPWEAEVEKASLAGELVGKWASIAYIQPGCPTAGRLVLDGWHPESVHTPHCHNWVRHAVQYAAGRTLELRERGVIPSLN
eukprot:TRINITY_DN98_c0_g1_i1.p1 TRINITY_DN98_c0_g1~~TRINITY_DN98_c0_g1_i1.p1  ORF type:complete len:288 (+),score=17.95 TRINITY_DN98_c0_g1_i1:554-1417(+)